MQFMKGSFRFSLVTVGVATALTGANAFAQNAAEQAQGTEELNEVVVTGFRASLESATNAKRDSVNITDSVFAEDIGKFPDLNIAESLNRIPGVQLTREVNGEGLNIAIRGLGTNFTKILLNGAQIAVASSGRTDSSNQNREVDLDLFPTELFTRLDVNKTPMASQLEGGVSGVVNMRSARPFDSPGTHFTYQAQGGYSESGEEFSPRGALTASWSGEQFGVLVGIAGVNQKSTTTGFETIGWSNYALAAGQCDLPSCDTIGGNNFNMPATVPVGAGNGLTNGQTIDAAFLHQLNPGVTMQQLGDALIPRLARPSYISGTRDRYSGLVSLEYRPSDTLRFYGDTIYSHKENDFERTDMNWVVRSSAGMIPRNLAVDENHIVTHGEFINSQFFLEARPYNEETEFWSFNPGMHVDFTDNVAMDFQLNQSRSWWFRESPTVLVSTPLNSGILVTFDNEGQDVPSIETTFDLNDPNAGWSWVGGRLNLANEKRLTKTSGAHVDFTLGSEESKSHVKFGAAYDEISRGISSRNNDARWEDVACRNGLDANGNSPATGRAPCNGLNPNSLIPQSALASYLLPGPTGFITVDFDRFKEDSGYRALFETAPENASSSTGANTGNINERTLGAYIQVDGESEVFSKTVRYNLGGRYAQTDQAIDGVVTVNGTLVGAHLDSDYSAFLPSFNAALNATDDLVLRFSTSRTITRANPSQMLPNMNFSDPAAQTATQGNPTLTPFLSTNFDIGGEWYSGDEGYIGLTLFAKQITGSTVTGSRTIQFRQLGVPFESLSAQQQLAINNRGGPDSPNSTVTVTTPQNAPGTLVIQGYEANIVQPLNFLLQGLGFSANYTRVSQHAEGSGINPAQAGIAPTTYNATAYYENHDFTFRASYTHYAQLALTQPNTGGQNNIPSALLFADAYGQLDISASYSLPNLPSKPQITLNVINATSATQRATFMQDNATWTFYDPGYSIILGLRGTF
jgi:TonB-dependent receptor